MNHSWQNRSPGDLRILLETVESTPVAPALARSVRAWPSWAALGFENRLERLLAVESAIREQREPLALAISLETGKPLSEARGELGAVLGKFALTIQDAKDYIMPKSVTGGPYPAEVRFLPRGPAVVIGPFNFPLHLANGAIVPHLLAGNTVLFKPSPLAAVVAARYAALFEKHLPEGVFQVVQGGGESGMALCVAPEVRAICFTGSVEVGKAIALATATDFSKSVALELGGKNALILLEDGDPVAAARAAAAGICATAGQRCNDTSRAIIHQKHMSRFCEVLREELLQFQPGDPCDEETNLGVLVNEASHQRYAEQLALEGTWILKGAALAEHEGRPGYYVRPSARLWPTFEEGMQCPVIGLELFVPLIDVFVASSEEEMITLHNAAPFGLTASVFTGSRIRFESVGRHLRVGNLYANIPTTHSPSVLPFGGVGNSGNGKPAGRGFIRYVVDEQAVQFPEGF